MIRATIAFLTLSMVGGTLHGQQGQSWSALDPPQIQGFIPTDQPFVIDDYTAWNKFRVFATAIARPSRLSELRAAYAIPGSDINWPLGDRRFAQELADMNAVVGSYGAEGKVFFPLKPDIETCDAVCWAQALHRLQSTNVNNLWYILMFDRTDEHSSEEWREVLLDYNIVGR